MLRFLFKCVPLCVKMCWMCVSELQQSYWLMGKETVNTQRKRYRHQSTLTIHSGPQFNSLTNYNQWKHSFNKDLGLVQAERAQAVWTAKQRRNCKSFYSGLWTCQKLIHSDSHTNITAVLFLNLGLSSISDQFHGWILRVSLQTKSPPCWHTWSEIVKVWYYW